MNYFKIKFKNELKKNKKGFTPTLKRSKVSGFTPTLKRSKVSGFTLVETLVALSIFVIALLVMINLSADNIINVSYAKNKLTATYLAMDGLEYVRNVRDNNVLFGGTGGWINFRAKILELCSNDKGPCYFDSSDPLYILNQEFFGIKSCDDGCSNFRVDKGVYKYNDGDSSKFRREVVAEAVGASDDEIKITSTVYWTRGNKEFSVSFSDYLRNWNYIPEEGGGGDGE